MRVRAGVVCLLTVTLVAGSLGAAPAGAEPSPMASVSDSPTAPVGEPSGASVAAAGSSVPAGTVGPVAPVLAARSARMDDYLNSDGTHTAQLYDHAVNYRTAAGSWQPIDNTLRPDPAVPGSFRNTANAWQVHYAAAQQGIVVDTAAVSAKLIPATSVNAAPTVSGPTATYADVWPGVDLVYTTTGDAVKESLMIKTPGAAASFSFAVRTGAQSLTDPRAAAGSPQLSRGSDGSVGVDGTDAVRFAAPMVVRADGDVLDDAPVSLTSPSAGTLTLALDAGWLAAQPASAFPINVDPTITLNPDSGYSYKVDGYSCVNCGVQFGNPLDPGNNYWRTAAHWPYEQLFGDTVQNAYMTAGYVAGTRNAYAVNVYHATALSWAGTAGDGVVLASGSLNNGGLISGSGLASILNSWTTNRVSGGYFGFVGSEQPGVYTYQKDGVTLTVTYATPPGAPQAVDASAGNGQATVAFSAPASDGGAPVTSYTVTSSPGGKTATGAGSPLTVGGLSNGTSYTFTVTASNSAGAGPASPASPAVVPNALPAAVGGNCAASGSRSSDQQTSHQLSDTASLSWNPVNGNLALAEQLLTIHDVGQTGTVALRYNALNDTRPTLNVGWRENALSVNASTGAVTVTAPDGGCYVYLPNGSGYTKPSGFNASLTHPDAHSYDLRLNPSGVTQRYTDLNGMIWQLDSSRDATNGNYLRYAYSGGLLRQITVDDAPGRTVSFSYADPNNPTQPSTITDTALNRSISLAYGGPSGAMSSVTDPAGHKLSFGYSSSGQVSSVTDNVGAGRATTISYDSSRRAASWTYPAVTGASAASTFTPGYSASQTTLTDPNGHTASYTLSSGTVTVITDPNGNATSSTWSSHGDITARTSQLGYTTTYQNSLTNLVDRVTAAAGSGGTAGASASLDFPNDPGSSCTATVADALASYRPCRGLDPQGNQNTYTYDSVSQNVATVTNTGGAGGSQSFTYQGDGAGTSCGARTGEICTARTADGGLTSYGYDSAGDPTTITRPAGLGAITLGYDPAGRVTSRAVAGGHTAYYSYDGDDRITQVTYDATSCTSGTSTCVQYGFDNAGNLTSRLDGTGTTSYSYDAQNRPVEKKTVTGTTTSADTTAGYDPAGNLTSYTDPGGATHYGYDPANRVTWLAEPGTTSCTAPAPGVAPTSKTAGCTIFVYDQDNRRTDTYLPNGRNNHVDYDSNNRPTYLDNRGYAANPNPTTAARSYAYLSGLNGAAGALVSATGTAAGTYTSYYSYDSMNRLRDTGTSVNPTDATATSSWHYSANGDRTQATVNGATVNAAYTAADQLCWTATSTGSGCASPPSGATNYSYDPDGNQTTAGPTSYGYTALDQMTSSTTGGSTTSYGYADTSSDQRVTAGATSIVNGILGLTYTSTGSTTVQYLRDPAGTLIALRTGGTSYYYSHDRLGSTTVLTNTTGATTASYTYDPWGNLTSGTPTGIAATNPYRYANGYTDPTGLIKFRTRYYNPTLGAWTQTDPSGQGTNHYIYAGDNPISNVDPTGRFYYHEAFWKIFGTLYLNEGETLNTSLGATLASQIPDPIPYFNIVVGIADIYVQAMAELALNRAECIKIFVPVGVVVPYSGEHCQYGEGSA